MKYISKSIFAASIRTSIKYGAILGFSGIILSACEPSQPQTLGKFLTTQDYVEINLSKLATGHEMVKVAINGREGQFILDSGAGATVVHETTTPKFKLELDENSIEEATGAGGQTSIFWAQIDSISIGDEAVPMDKIAVMDLSHVVTAIKGATGEDIEGVIGQDILTTHNGIIDVKNSRLYLVLKNVK